MGLILMLLALFWIRKPGKKRKWGTLLAIIIARDGINLVPASLFYFKTSDLTVIFSVIAWIMTFKEKKKFTFDDSFIIKGIKYFLLFLTASALFSMTYYNLPVFDIIQGGRAWFVIILYFFFRKLDYNEIRWILNTILYLSIINGVLYIPQVLFNWHTLPYDWETFQSADGKIRYYNLPSFLTILSCIILLVPQYLNLTKRMRAPVLAMFIIDMILSENRTALCGLLLSLSIGLLMQGRLRKTMNYIVIGAMCITPFLGIILDRFLSEDNKGNNTQSDITNVLEGNFTEYQRGDGGTLTFRFAYVYERAAYLVKRPFGERLFGFGMVSDSNPWVRKHYKFRVGNYIMDETGRNDAMGNSDIAYGVLIPCLGFLGTIILLLFYARITIYAYTSRHWSSFNLALFASCISMWITSFSGSNLSSMTSLSVLLLWILNSFYSSERKIIKTV